MRLSGDAVKRVAHAPFRDLPVLDSVAALDKVRNPAVDVERARHTRQVRHRNPFVRVLPQLGKDEVALGCASGG